MRYKDCNSLQRKVVDAYPGKEVAEMFKADVTLHHCGDTTFIGLIDDADEDDIETLSRRAAQRVTDINSTMGALMRGRLSGEAG